MTAWIAALAFVSQTLPDPAGPSSPPAGDRRVTLDTSVHAALVADALPRRDVFELRPRAGVELSAWLRPWATLRVDARAEALASGRGQDARGEIRDLWVEFSGEAGDLRVGYGRLAWGKLDEIAPTDVVNPLDAARFLFEGRSEARLATSIVRGRLRRSEWLTLEGVVVPFFRRGVFDRLDESSSPFNLANEAAATAPVPLRRIRRQPAASVRNVSGGGRADLTIGRVDVGVAAFRGFDGLGAFGIEVDAAAAAAGAGGPSGVPPLVVVEEHPRFTMIGGDFETVTGVWAWRGEVAVFTERWFTAAPAPGLVRGRSVEAGIGFDRGLGEFRLFGSAILNREWSPYDPAVARADFSTVGSIERSFDRDRYFVRAFAVVNPADAAGFLRGVLVWKPSDRWSVDLSGGAFVGTSDDAIGRFRTRDFVIATLRGWVW